ncbi:dsRBD fold-containing protein [Streptomyces sp. 4N509B]|uniref:dsRBD fold-containing protein n=1 Tax=Streptomyces sp. 4N509B TaxID=3457413 RepID=UPI003FD193D9
MPNETWHVKIAIDDNDRLSRAEVRMEGKPDAVMVAEGTARANPDDENVPGIGHELAVARALSELSHQLVHETIRDIESHTHERVTRLRV